VYPERVFPRWRESVRSQRQALLGRLLAHTVKRLRYPQGHDRVFNKRIRADDIDGLGTLVLGQVGKGQPDELQHGGRVLPAAVTDNPGNLVRQVEIDDLLLERLNRFLEPGFRKCRITLWLFRCHWPPAYMRLRHATRRRIAQGPNGP